MPTSFCVVSLMKRGHPHFYSMTFGTVYHLQKIYLYSGVSFISLGLKIRGKQLNAWSNVEPGCNIMEVVLFVFLSRKQTLNTFGWTVFSTKLQYFGFIFVWYWRGVLQSTAYIHFSGDISIVLEWFTNNLGSTCRYPILSSVHFSSSCKTPRGQKWKYDIFFCVVGSWVGSVDC